MKILNTVFNGFNRNVFQQLAGPFKNTFLYLPRPCCKRFLTASENSSRLMPLRCNTCSAISSHFPRQPSTHGFSSLRYTISTRDNLLRTKSDSAFSVSQPILRASSTALEPLFAINCARSVFPSLFCWLANTTNSTRVLIPRSTAICDTSNMDNDLFRLPFCYWCLHHLLQDVFPVMRNLHLSLLVPQHFADLDDSWTVVMNYLPWLYTSRRCNNCRLSLKFTFTPYSWSIQFLTRSHRLRALSFTAI